MTNTKAGAPLAEAPIANSRDELNRSIEPHHLNWTGPVMVMVGRTILLIAGQAVVAAIFFLRQHPSPWNAAAPWWTVYGTLADLGCLALMWKLTAKEGVRLRDLIGQIRPGRDIALGFGCLLIAALAFSIPGFLASKLGFETARIAMYPGLFAGRKLPLWAMIYSLCLFWPIWSPTEEMSYNGFALPRIQKLTGHKWIAVLLVGFWWALQHSFHPFVLSWTYVLWRFLFFLPGTMVMALLYLRIRRLPPLILAHWVMDISAVVITLKF